jgi:hypothetical protein
MPFCYCADNGPSSSTMTLMPPLCRHALCICVVVDDDDDVASCIVLRIECTSLREAVAALVHVHASKACLWCVCCCLVIW